MAKPVIVGSARVDERGQYKGGQAGSQIDKEISKQDWYLHPKGWILIRPKDSKKAEKIAKDMEYACDSKYVGYDQNQNKTLYEAVKSLDFDISKLKTMCETDCARLVRVCVKYAGVNARDFYTGTMRDALEDTGEFEILTSDKYCESSDYLKRGDILVTKTQGHTVVVLSDGAKITKEEKGDNMAYTMKTNIAHKSNYGAKRSLSQIKYIVIHYTANDGDTDENNGKYFDGANRNASAHYFVDDDSVTQSVPDDYVAWHCGGGLQGSGGHSFYKQCTNTNSIGIEICDDIKNGVIYPSAKTIENVVALTKSLMKKYNVPASRVIRHYDVTGKTCPAYWCGTTAKNAKWKTEFWNKLSSSTSSSTASTSKPSSSSTTSTINKTAQWTGVVTASSLNVRTWAGAENPTVVFSPLSRNSKVEVCDSKKASDGSTWYYIKYNGKYGFVHSSYIKKEEVVKYKTTANLNLRSAAGVINKNNVLCVIPKGSTVTYKNKYSTVNGVKWYYVTYNGKTGYASGSYLKKV